MDPYRNSFACQAMQLKHPHWENAIRRSHQDSPKVDEIRSEFDRDCGRILHSLAYSRLKSKTQVFFHTNDDSICTRIEHVNHVISVSSTIARFLGLNVELTYAIAMGHDLGHAPFGHKGEKTLDEICAQYKLGEFWHEQNSLCVVDCLELLPGPNGQYHNLNLTYAVRDGIISHCGEVNQQNLKPRETPCDLNLFSKTKRESPYTWEGCVVKFSDKIAYLGRDLEDAQRLRILGIDQIKELNCRASKLCGLQTVNNTNLIHTFITDLCRHSNPAEGLCMSDPVYELMKLIMKFNSQNIYGHPRLKRYDTYAALVVQSLYDTLSEAYQGENTLSFLEKSFSRNYPRLSLAFQRFLETYSQSSKTDLVPSPSEHIRIYHLQEPTDYFRAIVEFISLLTDRAAIDYFGEITSF